jgi:hypothetical protein
LGITQNLRRLRGVRNGAAESYEDGMIINKQQQRFFLNSKVIGKLGILLCIREERKRRTHDLVKA